MAIAGIEGVAPLAAGEAVVAAAAEQEVVAEVAGKGIVVFAAMELIIASEAIDAGGGVLAAEDVIVVGSACDDDPLGDVLPSPSDGIGELEGFDGVGSAAPAGSPEGLKEAIEGELIAAGEGEDQVVLLALEELEVRGFKIEELNLIEVVV